MKEGRKTDIFPFSLKILEVGDYNLYIYWIIYCVYILYSPGAASRIFSGSGTLDPPPYTKEKLDSLHRISMRKIVFTPYYRSILDLENIGIYEYTWILDTIDLN